MPENEIIGKGTHDQIAHAREFLTQERAIGKTPLHGESIKTSEERQFISSARQALEQEFNLSSGKFPDALRRIIYA